MTPWEKATLTELKDVEGAVDDRLEHGDVLVPVRRSLGALIRVTERVIRLRMGSTSVMVRRVVWSWRQGCIECLCIVASDHL